MKPKFSKFLSMILIAALIVTLAGGFSGITGVSAADENLLISSKAESVKVYVTINDNTGKTVVKQQGVDVTDADGDGTLTINDALIVAHDKKYKGGSEAGYGYELAQWGLSITKLWGDESQWWGIAKNNEYSSIGIGDTIAEGDFVDAYCYSDSVNHSDVYGAFDTRLVEVKQGKKITLLLNATGYDANWNVVVSQVKNAVITSNNKETAYKTNKKGKVTLKFDTPGSYFISAESPEGTTLVPPACIISVLPKKGTTITVDKLTYTVTKAGSLINNKKGKVSINISDVPEGTTIPKTIKNGGITYKVKKISE